MNKVTVFGMNRIFNAKAQRLKGAKEEMDLNYKFFFASLRLGVFALNSVAFLCGQSK